MHFEEDALYHVYNRSNSRVFVTRENYLFFLKKVSNLISPVCEILAWCLMPNHFHFLIQATKNSQRLTDEKHRPLLQILSKNMGTLISSYTQAFNKQQGRIGALFSHNTKAKLLNDYTPVSGSDIIRAINNDYATQCLLYIHQNPVSSGLVSKPEDWEFSSFRDFAGLRNGKLANQELAFSFIELDKNDFCTQSKQYVNESCIKKFF